MTLQYTLTNNNSDLVDAPFAKMRPFMLSNSSLLGFPPTPVNGNVNTSNFYRRAAELLGLISLDTEYVAARIRHLDFVARTSSLAEHMTWRSTLKNTWNESKIFDKAVGFFSTTSTPNVILSGTKIINTVVDRILWNYSISASTNNTSSIFTIQDADGSKVETAISRNASGSIALMNSGYNLQIDNKLNANQNMTGTITVRWPYKADLIDLKNNIVQNTDLLVQLTINNSELLKYLTPTAAPEDVLAAFLLAINSI